MKHGLDASLDVDQQGSFQDELALLVLLGFLISSVLLINNSMSIKALMEQTSSKACIKRKEGNVTTHVFPSERVVAFSAMNVTHDVDARRHRPLLWIRGVDVHTAQETLVSSTTLVGEHSHLIKQVRTTMLAVECLHRTS
jgi:hypothetical protein